MIPTQIVEIVKIFSNTRLCYFLLIRALFSQYKHANTVFRVLELQFLRRLFLECIYDFRQQNKKQK